MKNKKLKDLTLEEIKKLCDSREKCDGCVFHINNSNCFVFRFSQKKLNETIKLNDVEYWYPKINENYYLIANDGTVEITVNKKMNNDYNRYAIGNMFKTKKEAEFKLEQIKVYLELKNFALKNNECNINWNNIIQYKYVIVYNNIHDILLIDKFSYVQSFNQIYFTSKELALKAIEEVGEERIKKYLFEKN